MKRLLSFFLVSCIGLFGYWYTTRATPEQQAVTRDLADSFRKDVGSTLLDLGKDLTEKGVELVKNREDIVKDAKDFINSTKQNLGSSDSEFESSHLYGGVPRSTTYPYSITVIENSGFITGYCEHRNNPAWTAYRVFSDEITKAAKRPSRFKVDSRTTSRISHDDYTNSGYDRGHMAPNWTTYLRYGRDAQIETFLMSNIVPQTPSLNRQVWRELEETVAKEYGIEMETVWVITGPIYDDEPTYLPGDDRIEIPDSFYKIIVDEVGGKVRALSYIIDQEVSGEDDLDNYTVSIDQIENLTGFDFLSSLEDDLESSFESKMSAANW
jgi:endonuclease G